MDWFTEHSEELSYKYPGKHLAIVDDKVVAVGDTIREVYEKAKAKFPGKNYLRLTYLLMKSL